MQQHKNLPNRIIKNLTLFSMLFMIGLGGLMVFTEIKPFWVDEWFIITSLKTKSLSEIFGQLAFMQQFPRVYLSILKVITQYFNYSYISLRLPSYLVSIATISLAWNVMKKLFSEQMFTRYLFMLVLISSFTFTEYFVEIKQYVMDIFLCVLAVWQLIEQDGLSTGNPPTMPKYVLLCFSFLAAPYFSYTYPIAIAPVYFIVFLQSLSILNNNDKGKSSKIKSLTFQWVPLVLCSISIFIFYLLDAGRLVTDKIMYDRWDFLMINNENKLLSFLSSVYTFFAQLGAGVLFENLLGTLGALGFIVGCIACIRSYSTLIQSLETKIRLYSCLVLCLTFLLFLLKKLPLGTPRLNAFATPSICILTILFLNLISEKMNKNWQKVLLPAILYAGLIGNIFTTFGNSFTSDVYKRQLQIYNASKMAISDAQSKNIPILITNAVTYPYEQAVIDAGAPDPGAWVLKTMPAYNMQQHLPVYNIIDSSKTASFIATLPATVPVIMAGDGINYHLITRPTQ